MSDGILNQGYLFPFRQYDPAEVVNLFALNGTGLNGQFVSYDTGSQAPENADGYSTLSVGAQYTNIVSNRYLTNRRVHASLVGETAQQCAGVTLHTTAEYDENGRKLVLEPSYLTVERGFVVSGQTVPILKRGLITISLSQVANRAVTAPLPGYSAVLTGAGQLAAITPALATGSSWAPFVVGRFVSSSGAFNGGSIQFEVQL